MALIYISSSWIDLWSRKKCTLGVKPTLIDTTNGNLHPSAIALIKIGSNNNKVFDINIIYSQPGLEEYYANDFLFTMQQQLRQIPS